MAIGKDEEALEAAIVESVKRTIETEGKGVAWRTVVVTEVIEDNGEPVLYLFNSKNMGNWDVVGFCKYAEHVAKTADGGDDD